MKRRFLLLLILELLSQIVHPGRHLSLYLFKKWFNQQQFIIIDQICAPKTVHLPAPMLQTKYVAPGEARTHNPGMSLALSISTVR